MENKVYDCLIIGCGPCGIGAAIALSKTDVDFAIIEKSTPGGKVNIAPRVDNYPGQHEIPGPELAMILYQRILDNNIKMIGDEVEKIIKNNNIFTINCKNGTFSAKSVLIASGTTEVKLDLPRERHFFGHGLSYCAVCDGHFFKGKDVLIIGGGNSALKEAIYLAPFVNKLYLIHRRNEFRGNDRLVDELRMFPNVEIITPYIPVELLGGDALTGVRIQHRETGEERVLNVDGVFPLVGQLPNTNFAKDMQILNQWGTVPVDKGLMTSEAGIFAGGDVLPRDIRQIYLAEHDGMIAAKSILAYLNK